jgi:rfaE bifunctional protein nucleotidyltransferase chain/domain
MLDVAPLTKDSPWQAPLLTAPQAVVWAKGLAQAGKQLIVTNGCFDLLHAGHVTYLQQARALGDALLVAINTDASVSRLKGPARPVVPEAQRAALLGALSCVDAVVLFDDPTPEALLVSLAPAHYAKGGDYTADTLPEAKALLAVGAQLHFLPTVAGWSTTQLIARIQEAMVNPASFG